MAKLIFLVPLFPLLGAIVNGLFGRRYIRERAHIPAILSTALALVVALLVIAAVIADPQPTPIVLFDWVIAPPLSAQIGFLADPLSAIMLLVVAGVGFLIHVYSIGYMHGDPGYHRYFAYLNLFMFFMLTLVTANNYLLMFVGWEGVGLCSYLLIGFWFERQSAADAGKKAFVVNRVGDAGFLLGMFLIFTTFGTFDYLEVFPRAPGVSEALLTAITLCLFVGAMGKSAQIPLYVWLPDAMEGPTPVSALIHAATMVTAGVYMVARSHAFYALAPISAEFVAWTGGLTAIFAASIGLVQNDIKRVLAYSTVSQLGYMFLAAGVGASIAAIFHLMTHAFFKGLLFLAAGSVIHALSGEQDMRKMGGLWPHLPITRWVFVIGALAIAGIPPLAGFWSKDEILAQAFNTGHYLLWFIGVVGAVMTAFYMFRLILLTFFGESRVSPEAMHHLHESPAVMTVPLVILAALSVIGGIIPGFPPEGGWIHGFLGSVIGHGPVRMASGVAEAAAVGIGHAAVGGFHWWPDLLLMLISIGAGVGGVGAACYLYILRPDRPARLAADHRDVYELLLNKYWVDELYECVFVRGGKALANVLWRFDDAVVDGAVNGASHVTVRSSSGSGRFDLNTIDGSVNGLSMVITGGARVIRLLQTGFVQNYVLAIVLGLFVIVTAYVFF
ncbi:MAG: NADH-quinone oxidoreductase subunit L [Nitrospinae bacterium]|nr:NADH-quinone oxidoreductase subunit L [Nitrospinota bacterium]